MVALAITFSAALTTAMPPTLSERDPYVSRPFGEIWVSPCRISTSSNGTPSWSATIWLNPVSWPCPCGEMPVITSTLPVASIRMPAASQPPAP